MSPTKQELQDQAAYEHWQIGLHHKRLGETMLALAALEPPAVDPPETGGGGPVIIGGPDENFRLLPTPVSAQMIGSRIGLPGNWWPGATKPWQIPTEKYRGTWKGYDNGGAPDPLTNVTGTLWAVRIYDAFGVIEDAEFWDIGDFYKGAEGHAIYGNFCPHLDATIRNLRVRRNGANSVQRVWRKTETSLPESLWGGGGGLFTIDGADLRETGLIDESHGGQSVRASWTLSLYATMQRTEVRNVTHVNYYSPPPHEGTLFIGPVDSSPYRTPFALFEDSLCWTPASDRAEAFFGACDEAVVRRVALEGESNYLCFANDCGKVVVAEMPYDTEVRIQPKEKYHGPPVKTYLVKKGTTLELTF